MRTRFFAGSASVRRIRTSHPYGSRRRSRAAAPNPWHLRCPRRSSVPETCPNGIDRLYGCPEGRQHLGGSRSGRILVNEQVGAVAPATPGRPQTAPDSAVNHSTVPPAWGANRALILWSVPSPPPGGPVVHRCQARSWDPEAGPGLLDDHLLDDHQTFRKSPKCSLLYQLQSLV